MACAVLVFGLVYLPTRPPVHTDKDAIQEKGQRAWSVLRQFMIEAQDSLIETPLTNAIAFTQWTKSYSLSTNRSAVKLRSECEAVWVNNHFDAWLDFVKEKRYLLLTAMVGEWRLQGTNGFIGVNFKGEFVGESAPPDLNFTKLDFTESR
jgi:hypothetical protein